MFQAGQAVIEINLSDFPEQLWSDFFCFALAFGRKVLIPVQRWVLQQDPLSWLRGQDKGRLRGF